MLGRTHPLKGKVTKKNRIFLNLLGHFTFIH